MTPLVRWKRFLSRLSQRVLPLELFRVSTFNERVEECLESDNPELNLHRLFRAKILIEELLDLSPEGTFKEFHSVMEAHKIPSKGLNLLRLDDREETETERVIAHLLLF